MIKNEKRTPLVFGRQSFTGEKVYKNIIRNGSVDGFSGRTVSPPDYLTPGPVERIIKPGRSFKE
jgi:hypothetical protein